VHIPEYDKTDLPERTICRRLLPALLAIATCTLILNTCSQHIATAGTDALVVEKEVLLSDVGGWPKSIIRMANGDFLIAGTWAYGKGWAVRTNAEGRPLWKYEEPSDPKVRTQNQSEFNGAVSLTNGSVLICGRRSTAEGSTALITILDAKGSVVERRLMFPHDNEAYSGSTFHDCIHWASGIALLGTGRDSTGGISWLVKLDSDGAKQWDRTDSGITGFDAAESADHTLLLLGAQSGVMQPTLVRLDEAGEVVAKRDTAFAEAKLLRPVVPSTTDHLVAVDANNAESLHAFGKDLKDIGKASNVPQIILRDGRGFVLADGFVALFGNIAGSVYRSAMAWAARPGKGDVVNTMSVPDPQASSVSIRGTVPIGPREFVTVRDQESAGRHDRTGIVISWVKFQ
jgi:hypothetical protein